MQVKWRNVCQVRSLQCWTDTFLSTSVVLHPQMMQQIGCVNGVGKHRMEQWYFTSSYILRVLTEEDYQNLRGNKVLLLHPVSPYITYTT